jgi:hypothetical protein
MKENVVSLRACFAAPEDHIEDSPADQTRDYILDMVQQLAQLARDRGESQLGSMLDEVSQKHDPLYTPGAVTKSS